MTEAGWKAFWRTALRDAEVLLRQARLMAGLEIVALRMSVFD